MDGSLQESCDWHLSQSSPAAYYDDGEVDPVLSPPTLKRIHAIATSMRHMIYELTRIVQHTDDGMYAHRWATALDTARIVREWDQNYKFLIF